MKKQLNRRNLSPLIIATMMGLLSLLASPSHADGPFKYYTITPCRFLDSRTTGSLPPNADYSLVFLGKCGLPATARAVNINLTVVNPPVAGNISIHPPGTAANTTSSLNFTAGQVLANGAVAAVDATQKALLFPNVPGTTLPVDVVIDVTGYFAP
jgi:hypothetical protein